MKSSVLLVIKQTSKIAKGFIDSRLAENTKMDLSEEHKSLQSQVQELTVGKWDEGEWALISGGLNSF